MIGVVGCLKGVCEVDFRLLELCAIVLKWGMFELMMRSVVE